MFTFLAFLGKAAWPLIGSLVPWGGAKFGAALGVILLALVVIGGPAGAVWMHMRGECKAAVAGEKHSCQVDLANKETALQRTLADILEGNAKDDTEEPVNADAEAALCAKSPFCVEAK